MWEGMQDISGNAATSQADCQDLCSITPMCNMASFYKDSSSFVGFEDKNCWLKTLANSCEVPSDAIDDPNAVMLLKVDMCTPPFTPFALLCTSTTEMLCSAILSRP
jgi:hypothetical protein